MMKSFLKTGVLAVGLLCAVATNTQAGFINTFGRGNYNQTGYHNATDFTYYAGGFTIHGQDFRQRDFFAFDLSGITQTITSAKLRLYNVFSTANGLNYVVSDVSTSMADLLAGGSGKTAIYNDLGTGTQYGTRLITTADSGTFVEVTLNADALAALNTNRGGQIAFGGRLDGARTEDYLFYSERTINPSDGDTQLVFETLEAVPAPPALVLGVIGIASLLGVSRFARRKPVAAVA